MSRNFKTDISEIPNVDAKKTTQMSPDMLN